MDAMKEFQLRMQLMEGKELRFGINHPGTDKKEMVKEAIKSLQRYLDQMEERPEDYAETDPNAYFNLSVELLKVPKPSWVE